jgi:hypothetical protein
MGLIALYSLAMSMLPSVDNTFYSNDLVAWFVQIGWQCSGWVMKFVEDGSVLSFDSTVASTPASMSNLSPHSSRVASFTLVYIHTGRVRSWRGVMCFDK